MACMPRAEGLSRPADAADQPPAPQLKPGTLYMDRYIYIHLIYICIYIYYTYITYVYVYIYMILYIYIYGCCYKVGVLVADVLSV